MPAMEIGAVMEDGTIYADVSQETGNGLFVMPQDAPLLMNANMADGRCEAMNKKKTFGHNDWRLPTVEELKVLFENKEKGALRGTFNERADKRIPSQPVTNRKSPGWYRASDWGSAFASKGVFIKDGTEDYLLRIESTSVRFVRDGEPPVLPSPSPVSYVTSDTTAIRQSRLKKLAQARRPVIKPA